MLDGFHTAASHGLNCNTYRILQCNHLERKVTLIEMTHFNFNLLFFLKLKNYVLIL